jgi:APA family basic amino acid/polyamine antiporter
VAESAAKADARLVRALGTWTLAASIVNITVGGGIFRLPAYAAASLGPAAPLAYLACAVAMGLIVLCLAEAGSRVTVTGGPYAYVEAALGPFVGFIAGVLLWITGTFAGSAIAAALADSVEKLVPALGGGLKPGLVLLVMGALAAVNILGVRQSAWLNTLITALKLLPLFLLVMVGVFSVQWANLRLGPWPPLAQVSRTASLLIFAFCGVETALTPSGEVKDPAQTVPRAIGLGMAGAALVYISTQVVAQGILGPELGSETVAPLAAAATRLFGPPGATLLLVGASVSMLGFLGGVMLAIPRALFALARDGFLPPALAAVHPRFRTPHVAIALQSSLVAALALSSTFEGLAILANLGVLMLYALCCIAAWELRRRDVRAGGRPFHWRGATIVPPLACLSIAWVLTAIRPREWAAFGMLLGVASGLFLLARGRGPRPVLK